jgi:tripartite-type tricarboxylate transporter receptor subunit TctC
MAVRTIIAALVLALAGLITADPALAQSAKPVRLVSAFAPGAGPDILARLLADKLSRNTGQQVIVENRPGAGGMVAAQAIAHAPADGQAFFFATAAPLVTNLFTFKSLPYDPFKDFAPVAMIGKGPFFILANPSVPANTLPELIALDQAKPGALAFSTDGPKNYSGMIAQWLNHLAGTHFLAVPYANQPQGIQDAIAGRTQLLIVSVNASRNFVAAGQLKPLAVTSIGRVPGYDHVAPVAETFPGFDLNGWFAVVAPAGLPADILTRMNRNIDTALKDPEMVQKLNDTGTYTEGAGTPAQLAAYMRAEYDRWSAIVKQIGIEPE